MPTTCRRLPVKAGAARIPWGSLPSWHVRWVSAQHPSGSTLGGVILGVQEVTPSDVSAMGGRNHEAFISRNDKVHMKAEKFHLTLCAIGKVVRAIRATLSFICSRTLTFSETFRACP